MVDVQIEGLDQAVVDRQQAIMTKLRDRYDSDAGFRGQLASEAPSLLREMGLSVPAGTDVKVVANSPSLVHVVFPPDPNAELGDEMLSVVSGGGSTAGSAATVSTLGSIPGTWSSAATAGTAGTA